MNNHIFLRQVLQAMRQVDELGKPQQFDIECRSFNRNNKMGGALIVYKNVRLLTGEKTNSKKNITPEDFFRSSRTRKNPNHYKNTTRNIELSNGMIRKLNFRYITKFNGVPVVY